jgi:hypothetical protein
MGYGSRDIKGDSEEKQKEEGVIKISFQKGQVPAFAVYRNQQEKEGLA